MIKKILAFFKKPTLDKETATSLAAFFKKPASETKGKTPDGICPNCWGEQEFDNVVRELYRDHQIDVNNGQDNLNFIENVVVNKVEGIQLKKGNTGIICRTCRLKHA